MAIKKTMTDENACLDISIMVSHYGLLLNLYKVEEALLKSIQNHSYSSRK